MDTTKYDHLNTPENKARFFALYHGQEVGVLEWRQGHNTEPMVFVGDEDPNDPIDHLWLTPLSDILVDIYELLLPSDSDFLRSRGYALPYLGIPVEVMEAWGWLKVKTK